MWAIGHIPGYQARIDCWLFIRTYEERLVKCMAAYGKFLQILDCIRNSNSLKMLLSLVLACGNYLNGSTTRGQADGFDMETLAVLGAVKDTDGKRNLLHWVFEKFFGDRFFVRPHPDLLLLSKPFPPHAALAIPPPPAATTSGSAAAATGAASSLLSTTTSLRGEQSEKKKETNRKSEGSDIDVVVVTAALEKQKKDEEKEDGQQELGDDCSFSPSSSELLFEELRPVFAIVKRRIEKQSDGTENFKKQINISVEEYDQICTQINADFHARYSTFNI